MRSFKVMGCLMAVLLLSSCAQNCEEICEENIGVIPGTKTVVVKIALDKKGNPVASPETIELNAGDRIVWAGPAKYELLFTRLSPFFGQAFETEDGVINKITLTSDTLRKHAQAETKDGQTARSIPEKGATVVYKYDVIANGIRLDPRVRVRY